MAVYNCEPYLRETLDSIVNQNVEEFYEYVDGKPTNRKIPFEEIVQVIMVDDGSKDSSGAICDEYAAAHSNFFAVHKPNGGVASARNEGLKHVEGKYMNFMDSDDVFSEDVFVQMYRFFETHYDETDVITMPLQFFDGVEGPHWQNYKFSNVARVVDLFDRYDSPLMFVNASFFKSEYKDKVLFDGKLVCGEDIKYICTVLSEKMHLGLVPYCYYGYRRRSSGEESLVQSSKKKYGWYFDYLDHLTEWGVQFAKEKWGYIPYYFQNILVCDLQWRFLNEYEETAMVVLGPEKYEEYKAKLYASLKHFDDRIILGMRNIWKEHKHMMLAKKYGYQPERCVYPDDVCLRFQNTTYCWLSSCYTKIDFLRVRNGKLEVEGFTTLLGCEENDPVEVVLEVLEDGEEEARVIPCTAVNREVTTYRLDEPLMPGFAFKASVPLDVIKSASIKVVCRVWGCNIVKKDIRYGKFCPACTEIENSFYYEDGYMLQVQKQQMILKKASKSEKRKQQRAFYKELWKCGHLGTKKAFFARRALSWYKFFHRKPIWLIADRQTKAGDNGEAFFRYLKESGFKGAKCYFVVHNEDDAKKLKSVGKVVSSKSRRYKMLYLASDKIISSHTDDAVIYPFFNYSYNYCDIFAKKDFIFLQHGVTGNDISRWINRYNYDAKGFVCAAKPEYDSIVQNANYAYTDREVWLTGFARFDRLYRDEKKYITVMPTWRLFLTDKLDLQTGFWTMSPKFMGSEYFRFYNALLNDERLLTAAKQYGYTICYMAHPVVMNGGNAFDHHKDVIFFTDKDEYRDVYAHSDLILTDYSSAVFDFAYLRKPVVYAQFDYQEFFSGAHSLTKGYFDYERDGFGEVVYDLDSTVDTLIDYMKNGCTLKDEYRERIDNFFAFDDQNNCQRILNKILEMNEK